jgi:adenine-specific DNA-methyltransferase
MTGTASVASALRAASFCVTAVDVMTYSYHHARVALLLKKAPEFKGAKDFITKYAPKFSKDLDNYSRILEALNLASERKGLFLE